MLFHSDSLDKMLKCLPETEILFLYCEFTLRKKPNKCSLFTEPQRCFKCIRNDLALAKGPRYSQDWRELGIVETYLSQVADQQRLTLWGL